MKKSLFFPVLIGTGFGAGYWPWGPGTAGAVLATIVWWWLPFEGWTLCAVTAALIVVFTILGTWATARLEPHWGEDPSRVVVDEMVGVWTPLLLAGHTCAEAVAALLFFRFFDIVKPLGIRALDRRHGAFWVMADDLLAGVYAAVALVIFTQLRGWGN